MCSKWLPISQTTIDFPAVLTNQCTGLHHFMCFLEPQLELGFPKDQAGWDHPNSVPLIGTRFS